MLAIIEMIHTLPSKARAEFDGFYLHDFNIVLPCSGFWSFLHEPSLAVVRAIADASCAMQLHWYASRDPDGSLKE
ncbi:MAG: hypothetical protein GXP27_17765 [Planctomycetes bacterium]|nr:hypothetical protein [Planctomycetota bacterium]